MITQKLKVEGWSPEAEEYRGEIKSSIIFSLYLESNKTYCYVTVVRMKGGSNDALFSPKRDIKLLKK